ncbi:hypothetical protein BJV82DRAFT_137089 [Fennellomyces sp. T-0311]|nr:hypothetical protein BJV82DRAFT_137089 [Fennellomyces sp. T-0311]
MNCQVASKHTTSFLVDDFTMDVKMTRHVSTDLEKINKKIAQILRDPSDAFDQASVDIDSMTLSELKAFAEQGGLGACVSKADVLADTNEDLMYLSGSWCSNI